MEKSNDELLSNDEYSRYTRQLIMPTIGKEGQLKLKSAKVLIVGAGGLGSPASLYLAGAGIGTIGLVDGDVVDESNLHRQVIHTEKKVGVLKTESAKCALNDFNRHVDVIQYPQTFDNQNAQEIINSNKWDVVMDGSDNPKTRYLVNDICIINKIPLVSGSALQWEGQVTVYGFNNGPCYRCLFPIPPPPETVTNCADGGVLGMVPGIIGMLQATEIVKIILGMKDDQVLTKRMVLFDAMTMKFRNVKLRDRNNACKVCGDSPTFTNVKDFNYDDFCQTKCNKYALIKINPENNINVEDFKKEYFESEEKNDYALVDVRSKVQYNIVNIPGAINIPLKSLMKDPSQIQQICGEKKKVFIMCRRGNASKEATEFIVEKLSIKNVLNVQGGITEYAKKVDTKMPIY